MATIELTAKKREIGTNGALRALRESGEVPAVVYGGQKPPVSVSVTAKELKIHGGASALINLKVGSEAETVLLKDVQRDPISRKFIHLDFQRISLTEKIEVSASLRFTGEAPGVKLGGGILEHILREVRVRCLPTAIPEAIEVDVSGLQLNQGLRVKDLRPPEGVEVLNDKELLVANVVAPTILEETPAPGAVPAAAEPEVIAKGKKPEEGAEGAAPAKGADAKAAGGKAEAKPAGGK
ncbi:MAG: 50S ribosomal protein L25 [Elusimicrobiota bacterium]